MILHVSEASRLFPSREQPIASSPFAVLPKLEVPTKCLGFAMVDLARKIDATNESYVSTAVQVSNSLMQKLEGLSTDHLKKLESRASLLESSKVWSAVLSICSLIGSALTFFGGLSSQSPAASVAGIALSVLPIVYNALSAGVEQKDFQKAGMQFGCLLATALFFSYFQIQLPVADLAGFIQPGLQITQAVSGVVSGIYTARLTWKQGELEALQFFTKAIQEKLQEMTGSMADNLKSVATNVSFLNDVLSKYIATKTNFITR